MTFLGDQKELGSERHGTIQSKNLKSTFGKPMNFLTKQSLLNTLFIFSALVFSTSAYAENCTDKEYKTFKAYDAYLDANPQVDDDVLRKKFAARVSTKPAALKDLYFNCLPRWRSEEPAAANKALQDSITEMAAGGESPFTKGHSCRTLGFRYGDTETRSMLGKKPNLGWDFVMPKRCQNNSSTEAAIKEGVKNASK